MIHLFNRKELINVFLLEEQARIRGVLRDNNIDYKIKTVNRQSPSPFSSSSRARSGSFGLDRDHNYEYIIYVHKNQLGLARSLIRTIPQK